MSALASSQSRRQQLRQAPARKAPLLVAGTLLVAWMLAASKWGSYIQVGPLYIGDALLAIALVHYGLGSQRRKAHGRGDLAFESTPSTLIGLLIGWAAVRLIAGGSIGLDAFRDFAPYAYAVIGLLAASAMRWSSAEQRRRTMAVLWAALVFHLLWVTCATFIPVVANSGLNINGQAVFGVRKDIDGALVGVTAAIALYKWLRTRKWLYALIFVGSVAMVVITPSRAALIASAFAIIAVLWLVLAVGHSRNRMIAVALAPFVLIVALFGIMQTTAGERLASTFGVASAAAGEHASAAGTTEAREEAWNTVIGFTSSDVSRTLAGVGFGPDFMAESGAVFALLGPEALEQGVRSPHNYWIGTFARLGLPGLLLTLTIPVAALVRFVQARQQIVHEELYVLAAAIVVAVVATAAFGVTLESPFGAIPYYWAVGLLLGIRPKTPPVGSVARVSHRLRQSAQNRVNR